MPTNKRKPAKKCKKKIRVDLSAITAKGFPLRELLLLLLLGNAKCTDALRWAKVEGAGMVYKGAGSGCWYSFRCMWDVLLCSSIIMQNGVVWEWTYPRKICISSSSSIRIFACVGTARCADDNKNNQLLACSSNEEKE